ncbi:MAG: cell wall-binding repeat-containing protein [Actinomycetia bacterium]|nr:cell wall-binding repeat-containing protein [Actinomycetes bacterium]
MYLQDSYFAGNPSDDFETRGYPGFFILAKSGHPVVTNTTILEVAQGNGTRIAGANRYETAVKLSKQVFTDPAEVDTVFIATGFNFPDALGAAAAAGYRGAPVLLVGDQLPGPVAAELVRLKPSTIYVVGGTSAVSTSVANQLASYGTVKRLSGQDRYRTSVAVSREFFTGTVETVFIATGKNFPDALGAAAAAGHLGAPVLLVGDSLSAGVSAELARLKPSKIYVVGGTSVVSSSVESRLATYGATERLAGSNRYQTAISVSKKIFPSAQATDTVFVATGSNFPDALGAAAVAGHIGAPVLLAGDTLSHAVSSEVGRLDPATIYVVGGSSVISDLLFSSL